MFIVLTSWQSHCESSLGSRDKYSSTAQPAWATGPPTIGSQYYWSARTESWYISTHERGQQTTADLLHSIITMLHHHHFAAERSFSARTGMSRTMTRVTR